MQLQEQSKLAYALRRIKDVFFKMLLALIMFVFIRETIYACTYYDAKINFKMKKIFLYFYFDTYRNLENSPTRKSIFEEVTNIKFQVNQKKNINFQYLM